MSDTPPFLEPPRPNRPRLRVVAVLAATFSVLAGIALLSADARRAVNQLALASSDSSLWSVSQTEVELGRFEVAVLEASNAEDPDLDAVRRHFDILYSRIQIVLRGSSVSLLRENDELRPHFEALSAFSDQTVLLIDGSDEILIESIPTLLSHTNALRQNVRKLSLRGVQLFNGRSETRREDVASALTRLAILTVLLVVALAGGLYALTQMFRISRTEMQRRTKASQQLQAVVSASLDPIIATDEAGQIIEFNEAAEAVFGHPRADAVGVPMARLISPPHLRSEMQSLLAERGARTGGGDASGHRRILDVMRANGEVFPAEISVSKSRDENSAILVTYLRDISDRIDAERELVEARDHAVAGEKAKADLLAVMNHEMRTPLNGLLGTLELLESTPLTSTQRDYIQIMQRSGNNLLQNVNGVLEISRMDSGRLEIVQQPFDPLQLVRDIVEEQRVNAEARITDLVVEAKDGEVPRILGDEGRVRQILLNLVGNAIKFTRNGKISIDIDVDRVRNELTISVSDTGIGINPDHIDKIFDDFVTLDPSYNRSAEGSGLGLGICKRLVEAMGGEIGVESDLGEGSAFWFRLPAVPAEDDAHHPVGEDVEEAEPGWIASSVLVVEDNQINRRVAREMLQYLGSAVTEAHDGLEGVRLANLRRFDLILMDISMPGLDGLEATKRIRASEGPNADTPIVALTAHALPADLERFRNVGMSDVVTKPISKARLAQAIGRPFRSVKRSADAPLASSDDLIDAATLSELKDAMPPVLLASMIRQFFKETGDSLDRLSATPVSDAVPRDFADDIHRLAGSAAVFGAARLRNLLIDQEDRVRGGRLGELAEGFDGLKAVWAETRTDLEKAVEAA